jgi:glycosyltransferase involved in cell wall biosynthesis
LFAGRLLGWKGVALAVAAVARLVAAGHNVELDIAGDGPLDGFLKKKIQQLGLSHRVRLLGSIPREQLLRLYGHADLFVFPSMHDAGGTVVLEALSRGLPVICLDLGGPPNFIDGSCGAVVATHERTRHQIEIALADTIAQILAEPGALARLSTGAVQRARERSWENLVQGAYEVVHRRLGWLPVPA